MANDNRIELVAGLDVDGSVKEISTQLEKEVSPAVNAKQALKITCTLDTKNIAGLQKQLSELSKGVKLNINAGATTGIAKQVKSDVDAIIEQFNLIGKNIGGKKSDLRKALEEPIKEFKEAYSTGDIEAAWTKLSSIISKASKEIYTDNEVLLEQQKLIREQVSQMGKVHIDEKAYGDLKSIVGDDAKNVMNKVFGVGKWNTKLRKGASLENFSVDNFISNNFSEHQSIAATLGLDANNVADSIVKLYNILNQDPGKISVFETLIDEAGNATAAIDAVAAALKLPTGQYEEIAGGVYATEQFSEIEKEAPKAAQAIELIGEAYRDVTEQAQKSDFYPDIAKIASSDQSSQAAQLDKAKSTLNAFFDKQGLEDNANRIKRAIEDTSGELQRFYVQVEKGDKSVETLTYALNEQGDAYTYLGKTIREADNSTDFRRKDITTQWQIQTENLQKFISNAEKAGAASGVLSDDISNLKAKLAQGGVTSAMNSFLDDFDIAKAKLQAFRAELTKQNAGKNFERRVKTLSANMDSFAAANKRATVSTKQMSSGKTFAEEWVRLTTQMAKGAELTDQEVKDLATDFRIFGKEAKTAGLTGATAFEKFANSFKLVSTYISANQIINMITGKIREAFTELQNIDNILTEISKTSNRTAESLKSLGQSSFETASKYGRTASDYLTGVQEMSRAGFGEQQSENLAELSILAQSAGDMTADMANQYIIATNAAYKLEGNEEKLNQVLDSQNYITNHNALNMENLAEATKIAASQAEASGVAIDELTAAVGTMVAVTQQGGDQAGRAFKGILMNIQQVKASAADIGDGGEDITTESLTKYEAAAKALGVSLKEVKNGVIQLRDPMQVLKELSVAVRKESEGSIKTANLISAVGGKFRGNQLIALLENWETYEKMLSEYNSTEAVGSAMDEAQKSANNWAGSINKVKNSWNQFVNEIANSDDMIDLLEMANEGIKAIADSAKYGLLREVIAALKDIVSWLGEIRKVTFLLKPLDDWFSAGAKAAAEEERLMKERQERLRKTTESIESFKEESTTINDLTGKYVQLVNSASELSDIRNDLMEVQSQIIKEYGLEADAIDLVNGKLEENIRLLLEQEQKRNENWLTENKQAIEEAEAYFAEGLPSLSIFSVDWEDWYDGSAAKIEAEKIVSTLRKSLEDAGVGNLFDFSEYVKENGSGLAESYRFRIGFAEGLDPEQVKKATEAYRKAYGDLINQDIKIAEYFDLTGSRQDYINSLFDTVGKEYDIITEKLSKTNISKEIGNLIVSEEDIDRYNDALRRLSETTSIINDEVSTPTQKYNALLDYGKAKEDLEEIAKLYPSIADIAEASIEATGIAFSSTIANEQALLDRFVDTLDATHKTALEYVNKMENAMVSAIKGEGLSHDSAWELLKIDTEGFLKPIIDSAGNYHFELDDIIKLKDQMIERNKELIQQDMEEAKLAKQRNQIEIENAKIALAKVTADIVAEARGNTAPSSKLIATQADLRKQIDELEKSSKAYGDEIERDSVLITEYNAHMGDLSNTEKMLTAQTEALKKQQEQLKNEIDTLNKEADARLKAQEAKIDSIIDGYQAEVDELEEAKDLLQEQLDTLNEQKDALQEIVDNYESIGGIVENTISKQVEELEKSRQEVEDYYNNLIDKLKQENDEREDALNYAQKLADLENAKNNKVMVYGSGTGWTYEVDQDALAKAQRALDEADNDKAIKELEKARDAAVGDYDSQIKAYEEYGDKWTDVSKAIKEGDEEVLAEEILGAEWREKITGQDIELLEKYEKEYRDYNNQLKSLTKTEIKSLEDSIKAKNKEIETKQKQVKLWKDYKSAVQDAVSNIKNQLEDYNEFLDGVALKEDSTYDERQKNLTDFANAYQSLITQIVAKNKDLDAVVSKADEVSNQLAEIAYTTLTMKVDTDDASKAMADFIDKYREAIEDMQEALNESLTGFGVVNSAWDAKLAEAARALRTGSYAEGGSIPYTGIAMVHGKPNSAETAFNASQSRDLWNMVRTGNFSSMVADRALEGVNSALKNPNINSTSDSRVININGMVIKADNPKQFHDQFMSEINKYWDVQITDSPIR